MIIFTNSLPGGPYHRLGPVNASYACSDSGFMDQTLYLQWFEKTFLAHAVSQRPILLIQDGASSHISVPHKSVLFLRLFLRKVSQWIVSQRAFENAEYFR
ncbi:hypothetical protein DPMN_108551 [Dreissena polymorpha]|uniref:DDE-1 domain-containing protein n=1 Tax=Dreissena polymorpha TaxID=45954 RepID=A0A9D4K912_DREPO|nr:hypothetical protein DPMN_108551 [Dreissena polymorpha]